jgi:hypothetical protein
VDKSAIVSGAIPLEVVRQQLEHLRGDRHRSV